MSYTMSSASTSTSRTGPLDPNRLFVGNLSPTVDEYTLIQVFSKCGKVAKMDFLFHKTGPLKGKPRGYAFVEFSNKEDAQKAISKLHGRLLRGRNLAVTQASASQAQDGSKPYRKSFEPAKTTTLSLLKSQGKPQSTNAQIAALEAKIARMQNSPHAASMASSTTSAQSSRASSTNPSTRNDKGKGKAVDKTGTDAAFEQAFQNLVGSSSEGTAMPATDIGDDFVALSHDVSDTAGPMNVRKPNTELEGQSSSVGTTRPLGIQLTEPPKDLKFPLPSRPAT